MMDKAADHAGGSGKQGKVRRAAWALAAAMALLPFAQRLPTDFDRLGPFLLILPAWLLRPRAPAGFARLDRWLLVAVAFATFLAIGQSPHPAPSLAAAAGWTWVILGAVVSGRLARDPAALRLLLGGITAGGVIGTLAVWWLWRDPEVTRFPLYGHHRVFGLHAMVTCLAGVVLLVMEGTTRARRAFFFPAAVIVSAGLLWSGGRAPLLGVVAGLAAWFLACPALRRRILTASVLSCVAGALLAVALWTPRDATLNLGWWHALERTTAATTASELTSTRTDFWQVSLDAWRESPWWGLGPDAYMFVFPRQDGNQPHNWILQYLLDIGVLGVLPLGWLLIRQPVKGLRSLRDADPAAACRGAAAAVFTGCLIAALLDGFLYHALALLPAALCAGAAGARPEGTALAGPLVDRLRTPARIGVGLASGVLIFHAFIINALVFRSPPPEPGAWPARALRTLPTATTGLWDWLETWREHHPADALEWAYWAQDHSSNPVVFHIFAAQRRAEIGDLAAAQYELEQALAKAHSTSHASINRMLSVVTDARNGGDNP